MRRRTRVILLGLVITIAVCASAILFVQSYWPRRIAPTWIRGPLIVSEGALFHGEWEGGRIYEWSLYRFELVRTLQLTDLQLRPLTGSTRVHGVAKGTIIATSDRTIVGVDCVTGAVTWSREVAPREIIVGTAIYYLSADGTVGAMDVIKGHHLWQAPTTSTQAITISNNTLIMISPDAITALELFNGKEIWSYSYDGAIGEHKPLIAATQGTVLVIHEDSGGTTVVLGLNANTGAIMWSKTQPYPLAHVLSLRGESGRVYVFLRPGEVVATNTESGEQVWRQKFHHRPADIRHLPYINKEHIVVVSGYSLVELDKTSGMVTRRMRLPGTLSAGEVRLHVKSHYLYHNETRLYLKQR